VLRDCSVTPDGRIATDAIATRACNSYSLSFGGVGRQTCHLRTENSFRERNGHPAVLIGAAVPGIGMRADHCKAPKESRSVRLITVSGLYKETDRYDG
jgi:hypothetical protein